MNGNSLRGLSVVVNMKSMTKWAGSLDTITAQSASYGEAWDIGH